MFIPLIGHISVERQYWDNPAEVPTSRPAILWLTAASVLHCACLDGRSMTCSAASRASSRLQVAGDKCAKSRQRLDCQEYGGPFFGATCKLLCRAGFVPSGLQSNCSTESTMPEVPPCRSRVLKRLKHV
eukprot:s1521_g14.t1